MADERSVDVDERRDPEPPAGSRRPALAGVGQLPPVQQAWQSFVAHATHCTACRDIDRRCDQADALYRAWQTLSGEALRQIGSETA